MKNTSFQKLIKKHDNFIFVSPHLDDAVFSAGGLMDYLHKKNKNIKVINVFTKAGTKPYTFSVKKFLKLCGYDSAVELFKDRIKEDKLVLKKVGAKIVNLGFTDALWRKKGNNSPIAELDYIYPIFKLTIARGFISRHDDKMVSKIKTDLIKNIKPNKNVIIFCPAGIGRHTDHLIVRNAVSELFKNVVYWQDYPYIKSSEIDRDFVKMHKLKKVVFTFNKAAKNRLVNLYKSQVNAIFGKEKEIVSIKEKYYYST
jgi:LmbE family N-acetylglucosaminyl deacetylase